MSKNSILYIASNNQGKVLEISSILKSYRTQVRTLTELDQPVTWEETGSTFEENALIKARAVQKITRTAVIADDSGLCVPSIGGEPGVYSSRFGGEEGNAEKNIAKLLSVLEGLKEEERLAYFVCHMTFLEPEGTAHHFTGKVHGKISTKRSGSKGFGYDPIFIPDGHSKSFGELDLDHKNSMSHRSKALESFSKFAKSSSFF